MMSRTWYRNYGPKWKPGRGQPVKPPDKILAVSHAEAIKILSEHPKEYHLVYITDPVDLGCDHRYREAISKAKSSIVCLFRDIDLNETGKYPPTAAMVKKVIDWSNNKDQILVCCFSGISRASAMAYNIACKKFVLPEASIAILDYNKHLPNLLVVQLGSDVLKNPDMFGFAQRFREGVFARMS